MHHRSIAWVRLFLLIATAVSSSAGLARAELPLPEQSVALLDSYGNPRTGFADFGMGRVFLPSGWSYERAVGIDSDVGALIAPDGEFRVHYDHGRMAGAYVDGSEPRRYRGLKTERVGGNRMYYAMARGQLLVTIQPKSLRAYGAFMNFVVQPRNPSDIRVALDIARSLQALP